MSGTIPFNAAGFSAYVTKPEQLQGASPVVGQPGLAIGEHCGDAVLILRHEDGSMMSVQLDEGRLDTLCHMLAAHVERGNADLRRRSLQ
jgi:hypothetical protein